MTQPSAVQRDRYHRIRALMHERYPAAFGPRGTAPLPLKVGISKDLEAVGAEIGERELRIFLAAWTGRPEYLGAILAGGPRYDLAGTPVGEVTPAEQAAAAERLARIRTPNRSAPPPQPEPHPDRGRAGPARRRRRRPAGGGAAVAEDAKPPLGG